MFSNSRNRLQALDINKRIVPTNGILWLNNITDDPSIPSISEKDTSTSPYNVRVRIDYIL